MQSVYVIFNTRNGKFYVGETNNVDTRWKAHLRLAFVVNDERPFYASLRKHGLDAFEFSLLQVFQTREEALAAEIYWINFWNSFDSKFGYNLTKGGIRAQDITVSDDPIRQRKGMPESMRKATSLAQKGRKRSPETIENMKRAQSNRSPLTEEQRNRMRQAKLGKKLSDEHKAKISESIKRKKKCIP